MGGLVVAAEFALAGTEQFQFGAGGHKAVDGGKHLDHVRPVRRDQPDADDGTPVLVLQSGLGHRDVEAAFKLGQHGAHDGALLLEGVNVAKEHIEFNPANPHA